MEKFTKKMLFPVEESVFVYSFPYFRAWQTSPVTFFRLRKNSIKFSAGSQIFSVSRKTLLKTEVFEKRAKDQRNETYRIYFLVHRVWLYPLLSFGLHFFSTQKLCIFWVTFCNTYDFLGITSFTKKQNFSEKDFGLLFPVSSSLADFQEHFSKRQRRFRRKMCKF